jgi:hypothetical protein
VSLLERHQQLDALVAYAAEVASGDGRLVLVAEEADVGKSSLVEAAEAAVLGRWLWGPEGTFAMWNPDVVCP